MRCIDSVSRKARAIFVEAFRERGAHLFVPASTSSMMHTVGTAFAGHMNTAKAEVVGFHLGDWAREAAIVLALHMYPEKFTRAEIRQVTDYLAAGLPYHCAALGALFGYEDLARSGIRDAKQSERTSPISKRKSANTH